jgi:hypothetical protein
MPASTPDVREEILLRLVAVTTALGYQSSVRNRQLRSNDERPGTVLLDGDEAPALAYPTARRGRGMQVMPVIMQMKPELYVVLKEDRPTNVDVGEDLNARRIILVAAICEDAQLRTLVGSNGAIIYNGCVTDLKSGSALTGQMRLDFAFNYVFFPTA